MNAIQVYYAVNIYANVTQHSRFYFSEVNKAVNDAIKDKLDDIIDGPNAQGMNGIDRIQKFRDDLYTMIKTSTSAPTTTTVINGIITENHFNFPVDYQTYMSMSATIDGNTTYLRETDYNKVGPLLECSFRKPNNNKPYFLEDNTGLKLYRGVGGTFSSATLTYIKQPTPFNMGNESDLIQGGTGANVLTTGVSYTVVDESIYNGTTYIAGAVFTAGAVLVLASGQVILSSLLTTIELPEKCHDDVSKMAAAILLGVTSAFDNSAFAEKAST
jgi:hypothetical protein